MLRNGHLDYGLWVEMETLKARGDVQPIEVVTKKAKNKTAEAMQRTPPAGKQSKHKQKYNGTLFLTREYLD